MTSQFPIDRIIEAMNREVESLLSELEQSEQRKKAFEQEMLDLRKRAQECKE